MNGLQRRTTPTFELSGVAITTTMALSIQRVSASATVRESASTAIRLGPYFM